MATLAGQPITSGEIRMREQGDWLADISTSSAERIADGTRVELVVGTLTLSGAIVRGNITGDVGRYQLAGRPEWGNELTAHPTKARHSNGSVLLNSVLGDVCRETLGSSWASLVELPANRNLDRDYERPGTRASESIRARDMLALLGLSWYVRNDGVTVFGTRDSGTVSPSDVPLVSYRNDALGLRIVNTEDPAAFMPGKTFEGETIGETIFVIHPNNIEVHTWARQTAGVFTDAVKAIVRRVFPRLFFQGVFSYIVVSHDGWKHDLRSLGSRWLPDVKLARFWTGAGGHRCELQAGTRVGISFMDCDPAKPVMVCIEPSFSRGETPIPVVSEFDAATTISINASTSVNLGGAVAPVLRSGDIVTLTGAISPAGPNVVTIQVGDLLPTPPAPPVLPPTRVKA